VIEAIVSHTRYRTPPDGVLVGRDVAGDEDDEGFNHLRFGYPPNKQEQLFCPIPFVYQGTPNFRIIITPS